MAGVVARLSEFDNLFELVGLMRLQMDVLQARQTGKLSSSIHDIDALLDEIADEKEEIDNPRRLDPLVPIKRLIEDHFNIEEINDLAFDIGYNPESIAGETIGERARGLVMMASNNDMLPALLDECRVKRPHVGWPG